MIEPVPSHRPAVAAAARESAMIVAIGMAAYSLAPVHGAWGWVSVGVATVALGLLAPFTVHRARRVLASDRPLADGAVAITGVLTALVLGFSLIYLVLAQQPDEIVGLETRVDSVYFTTATLSTVGPGDIHAQGQASRVVYTVQILVDVIVLAGAVRLLTGVAARRRRGGHGAPTAPGDT